MICKPCGKQEHVFCDNLWEPTKDGLGTVQREFPTRTWCDCQCKPIQKGNDEDS